MRINELKLLPTDDQRTQHVSNGIISSVKNECGSALQQCKYGNSILKGFGVELTHTSYKIDPSLKQRVSVNTHNYYTVLMDNLPSWQEYPKRSRSLICSTSLYTARGFATGEPYNIFPIDGAKIAVCPRLDIWHVKLTDNLTFVGLNGIFRECKVSWYSYRNILDDIFQNRKKIATYLQDAATTTSYNKIIDDIRSSDSQEQLITALDNLYNPDRLGFKLFSIEQLPAYKNREVWIGSPCYAVKHGSPTYKKLTGINAQSPSI